jgi:isopenicillin N synthase-like dioxygenase
MTEFSNIPVLDVSALYGDDPKAIQSLATQFRETYATTGFGYIVGHAIAPDLVARVFAASKAFHALPKAEKLKIALDKNHRGFLPINTSTDVNSKLAEVKRPNQSESFMMMREDATDSADVTSGAYLAGPNQWPDLQGFREDVTAYHDAMSDLGRRLAKLVALALDLPSDVFDAAFERPTTWLRLLYYPSTDPAEGDDLYGSAPHTDFGFLTFLAQDEIGGLQVQTPAGNWVDAPKIENSFVLNVGDILNRWSGGVLKSTPHRVINRSGKARYSCPFFFDPHVSTVVAPLGHQKDQTTFEPIKFGAFLRAELEASYDAHKSSP